MDRSLGVNLTLLLIRHDENVYTISIHLKQLIQSSAITCTKFLIESHYYYTFDYVVHWQVANRANLMQNVVNLLDSRRRNNQCFSWLRILLENEWFLRRKIRQSYFLYHELHFFIVIFTCQTQDYTMWQICRSDKLAIHGCVSCQDKLKFASRILQLQSIFFIIDLLNFTIILLILFLKSSNSLTLNSLKNSDNIDNSQFLLHSLDLVQFIKRNSLRKLSEP